jgi:hypothetical protein
MDIDKNLDNSSIKVINRNNPDNRDNPDNRNNHNNQFKKISRKGKGHKAMLDKRNEQINNETPRETVVDKVLDRDRLYSIALPPTLKNDCAMGHNN